LSRKALPDRELHLRGIKSRAVKRQVVTPEHLDQLDETIPAHLPDSAAVAWVETVRALNRLGLGCSADQGVVESYALALGLMRDAAEMLRAEGLTHVDDRGTLRRHPAIAIANQAMAQVRQLAPRLGLTPTDRAGLAIAKPSAADTDDPILSEFGHLLDGAE
jgi:P27 family predicted phage terminase small subunit